VDTAFEKQILLDGLHSNSQYEILVRQRPLKSSSGSDESLLDVIEDQVSTEEEEEEDFWTEVLKVHAETETSRE
jgi:hypothetical protein